MTATRRRIALLLAVMAVACSPDGNGDGVTQPAPVTLDATISSEIAAEPTPVEFTVDPPDATMDEGATAEATADVSGETDSPVAAGEFRVTVSGEPALTFDSAGSGASAALVTEGDATLLRFQLAQDAGVLPVQEINIEVPGDLEPGEHVLGGTLMLGEGEAGEIPVEGRVTIDAVSAESVSGTFELTARAGSPEPVIVSGTFNQIPRVDA